MVDILLYLFTGLLVGTICPMLGIGGGVMIVPIMTFIFGASPQEAVGTSMLVILFNTVSGTVGYARKKLICWDAAWKFALATVPGAIAGGYVSDIIRGPLFYTIFGIFFILMSIVMFLKSNKKENADLSPAQITGYNWRIGVGCSIGTGFIASILGIGGGVVNVPVMTYLLKFPVKVAIATSTAMMAVSALAGFTTHASLGHVAWIPAIAMSVGAFTGAQIGVMFASKTRSSLLLKIVSLLEFAIGIKFIYTLFL